MSIARRISFATVALVASTALVSCDLEGLLDDLFDVGMFLDALDDGEVTVTVEELDDEDFRRVDVWLEEIPTDEIEDHLEPSISEFAEMSEEEQESAIEEATESWLDDQEIPDDLEDIDMDAGYGVAEGDEAYADGTVTEKVYTDAEVVQGKIDHEDAEETVVDGGIYAVFALVATGDGENSEDVEINPGVSYVLVDGEATAGLNYDTDFESEE